MTHNPVNAKRRQLSWRISFVYTVPVLLVTVALVFVFFFYLRSSLISTAYSSTEANVIKSVEECESYLHKREEDFLKLAKKHSYSNRQGNRLLFVKYLQNHDDVVDVYYGYSDGDYFSARGDMLDELASEFRTKAWYLEASRNKGLAITGPNVKPKSKKLVMTISYPIFGKNQQIKGVIAEDIDLMKIRQSFGTAAKNEGGITLLMENSSDNIFTFYPYETSLGKMDQDSLSGLLSMITDDYKVDSLMYGKVLRFEKSNNHRQSFAFMVTPMKKSPFYVVHIIQQNKVVAKFKEDLIAVMLLVILAVVMLMFLAGLLAHFLYKFFIEKDLNDSVSSSTLFDTLLMSPNFSLILTDDTFDILHASANVIDFVNNGEDIKGEILWKYLPSEQLRSLRIAWRWVATCIRASARPW